MTSTAEETRRVGASLGQLLRPGDLVLLHGSIGAGKTTFTQGVAQGVGLDARVTSPSFALANVYDAPGAAFPLYHLDLWRIKSPLEALGLGLEEYLSSDAACVVEWPDIADTVLPDEHLRIAFTAFGDRRDLAFHALGSRSTTLLQNLRDALELAAVIRGGAGATGD